MSSEQTKLQTLVKQGGCPRELIESRRGSETSLRGSFYTTQETSLTDLFFTLVRLVSETDFLPLQRLVSQRSKTGQRD